MSEERWTLPTEDGHTIYGVATKSDQYTNKKAIILVHGLTGHMYSHLFCMTAKVFPDCGYDVIRFNLYDWHEGGRRITDATFKTYAEDLDAVVEHFGEAYNKVFVCGHSFGGPTAMLADHSKIAALSLWDPSYIPAKCFDNALEKDDLVISGEGSGFVISKEMYDEAISFDEEWAKAISKDCTVPIQVIYATDGMWIKENESFHTHASNKKDEQIIEGTEHIFCEGKSTQQLFEKLYEWFDQF